MMELRCLAQLSGGFSTVCLVNSNGQRYYINYSQLSLMMKHHGEQVWIQYRDRDQDIAAESDRGDVVATLTTEDEVVAIELYVGPDDSDITRDPRTGQLSNIAQDYFFPVPKGDFATLFAALELAESQREQFDELFPKVGFSSPAQAAIDSNERLFVKEMMSARRAITA